MVTITKPFGSKTLFTKLTDDAYDRTRRQCGLLGFEGGYLMLRIVARYSVRPATVYQHVFVPEIKLNNGRGWGDVHHEELAGVQRRLLPALVAGWLDARCDSERHVYYFITEAGWRLLDGGSKPADVEGIKTDSRFELVYFQQLRVEREKLSTRTPNDSSELGFLPLPVSHHDMPIASRSQQ